MVKFLLKLMLRLPSVAVHSCYAKELESEILERSESDVLPPTLQPWFNCSSRTRQVIATCSEQQSYVTIMYLSSCTSRRSHTTRSLSTKATFQLSVLQLSKLTSIVFPGSPTDSSTWTMTSCSEKRWRWSCREKVVSYNRKCGLLNFNFFICFWRNCVFF